MKSILKDLPALFCPLVPEGSFPGNPIDQLLGELALSFPRIHLHLPITTSRFSLPTFASSLSTQALILHLHFCFSWHCSQLWEDWDVDPTHPCPPPTPQSPVVLAPTSAHPLDQSRGLQELVWLLGVMNPSHTRDVYSAASLKMSSLLHLFSLLLWCRMGGQCQQCC